ncbi:hypothetical protein DWG18_07645 [Lysobacter sp. TY2-98]|uniref:hypothetical protein n=1 Tax=Lysobacter sp. TY2-98 TaxID=2290922 RepID=UPI000E203433|nr:hypothetical protein [Lysobacter sp. TY2-98]AXK72169.1 hypothetical protein DWG18_07645 [Lysobacter sp. TY2-98]
MTMRSLFFALALWTTASGAQAAGRDIEARYGLDEIAFRKASADLFAAGYRLIDITVAEVKGAPVIGGVFQRMDGGPTGPERATQLQDLLFLHQTRDQLTATGARVGPQGSQLDVIDAYESNGQTVFAASFSPPGEPTIATVGVFLTQPQAADMRRQARASNNDLARWDVYQDGDQLRYLPSFVPRANAEISSLTADGSIQFNANSIARDLGNESPLSISAYITKTGTIGYAGLFDDQAGRRSVIGLTLDEFHKKMDPLIAGGAMIVDLDSATLGDTVFYSAVYVPAR